MKPAQGMVLCEWKKHAANAVFMRAREETEANRGV